MNFSDIYNKIKNIDEGGITWQPNPGTPAQEPIQDRGSYSPMPAPAEPAPVARPSITPRPAPAAMPAEGKDLGNGFTLTKTTVAGAEYPAVLDTQSNTYWIQNKNAGGTAIIRSPVQYISVVNGQMKGGQPGGETTAALQAAGLKESINENSNENFMSLYKQIRAIDEGTNPQHSHQYDTTMKHADNPTVQQRMAAHDIKPGVSGYRDRIDMLKDLERTGKLKDEGMEECGDMMALPMSMGHEHSGQEDSVTMSVSMNGSGDGGIRDLMNILKGIENVGEPHTDHDEIDVVFGGEMEPEMEEFANSMAGASKQAYFPQSAVTDIGSNDGRGDHEVRKASGGGNPYTQVSEELVSQLSSLYQEIKARQVAEGIGSRIVDKVIGGMSKQAVKQLSPEVVEQHYKTWIRSPNRPYNVDRGGNADMQQIVDAKVMGYLKTTDIPVEQHAELAKQLKRKFMLSDPSTHTHTN